MNMRVLIADDHPIFRISLAELLKVVDDDVSIVEASDYQEALDKAKKEKNIDLVLLDLRMPGMSPFEGLRELITERPDVPVVIVSAVDNRADALKAIDIGATGYIPKTVSSEEFENLLRRVLDGQVAMPRRLLERVQTETVASSEGIGEGSPKERIDRLTRRQQQVLGFLAHGKSNMQIAQDLGLSEKTVRLHVSAILKTLNLSNRTQAALLAARGGGIEPSEVG